MHAHITRPRRGGRIATALLLPAVGLGLLTACSSNAPVEGSEVVEEDSGQDNTEQICQRMVDLAYEIEDYGASSNEAFESLDDDVDDFSASMAEEGKTFEKFGAEWDEVAEDADDPQLADAIHEFGGHFGTMGQIMLDMSEIDLNSDEAMFELFDAVGEIEEVWVAMDEGEEFKEATDYMDKVCGPVPLN